ncbi:MAG: hypothetical protein ACLT8A_10445 [Subdoligranulum sp.]
MNKEYCWCAARSGANKIGWLLWLECFLPEQLTWLKCDAVGGTHPLFIILSSFFFTQTL